MIQDPSDELLAVVRRSLDEPTAAERSAVALVRRRFGLSVPLPFAPLPTQDDAVPIRAAVAEDGPAMAATKWRSFRVAYRGILPDEFLDHLAVYPPAGYWIGRAAVPPTNRHGLFVAGAKGTVLGLAAVEPTDTEIAGSQLKVLYVDPLAQRRGLGRGLAGAAIGHARTTGAEHLSLWVAEQNRPARSFYEATGWVADGQRQHFELEPGVGMDEIHYRFTGPMAP